MDNTKELEFENKAFYEWMDGYNTAYCYLMRGDNKTYVGIIYKDKEYVMKYPNKTMEDVLKHLKFNKRKTNKDENREETHNSYDKSMLNKCRQLTQKEYNKDNGLNIKQIKQRK